MLIDVQGTFVSEKVSKVRWVPAEYEDSRTFLSGSWDNAENFVRMWTFDDERDEECDSGPRPLHSTAIDGDVSGLLVLNAAGTQAAAVATSHGDVHLLGLFDLKEIKSWRDLHVFDDGSPSPCTGIATLDGDIVTVGEDGKMNFLSTHRAQVVRCINNADSCTLHCVCFLKHNEVITGNLRGQMKIWDLRSQSNNPSSTFLLSGDQVAATSIVNHPTQRHLVLAGSENGALAVWDLRVNTYPASLLNAHSGAVTEIQFHPDHPQRLFTCSASGEIWHWNTSTMSKQITTTASISMNESTINPWLMNDEDRSKLEVSSLMADLHKSINSLDCNKNRVICGCDNEAVYLINNVFT